MLTCSETLDLLVFSLTLARAPLSPEDLSVISRAALSSLGVSVLTGAARTWGGSLGSSLGSGFFPLVSIFLWTRQALISELSTLKHSCAVLMQDRCSADRVQGSLQCL